VFGWGWGNGNRLLVGLHRSCQVGCADYYFHARLKINLLVSFLFDAHFNFNVF